MDDKKYAKSFELILHAGNAKFNYQCAVEAAKKGDEEKVKELIEEGNKDFLTAHDIQNDLIKSEMNGEGTTDLNVLFVHAQDHLTMATIYRDQANDLMNIYREISALKKRIEKLENQPE